jgi:hypothetical protein
VFQVFCEIGDIDPNADRWDGSYDGSESNREYLRRLWDEVLEGEPDAPTSLRDAPHGRRRRAAGTCGSSRSGRDR